MHVYRKKIIVYDCLLLVIGVFFWKWSNCSISNIFGLTSAHLLKSRIQTSAIIDLLTILSFRTFAQPRRRTSLLHQKEAYLTKSADILYICISNWTRHINSQYAAHSRAHTKLPLLPQPSQRARIRSSRCVLAEKNMMLHFEASWVDIENEYAGHKIPAIENLGVAGVCSTLQSLL
jgi:hypothetical protein